MKRYIVQRYYKSDFATYAQGDVIDLEDDIAAWLNRDSPGVIREVVTPEPQPEPAARVIEEPPQDRMVKTAKRRASTRSKK